MSDLASKTCVPCRGDVPPLEGKPLEELSRQLPGWEVVDGHHLRKAFRFANFRQALDFVNRVGELAEEQAHHPDVDFGWGRAGITIYTHKIDGLTESDFVLAAKVDRLYPA
jgi:4a-hydroxytetrahydrobiopterin dehydratase